MTESTIKKVFLHILPLACIGYFIAYLDKINVGFAALTMRGDLHLSATEFGVIAGLFFWGYAFLEIPSNLALSRFGPRLWLSRIMITWGIISAATAFVGDAWGFGFARILLGIAEAGFFPGILLWFTYWFPNRYMARAYGIFSLSLVISPIIGAPLSTAIMGLDGLWGLKGWQLMFILEAAPAVIFGLILFYILPNKPADVSWLSESEKQDIQREIEKDSHTTNNGSWWVALKDSKILLLSVIYLCYTIGSIGMVIFLPQIIQSLGKQTIMTTGWLTTIPYCFGALSLLVFGWTSDKTTERKWHVSFGLALTAMGLILSSVTLGSYWALVGLSLAAIGMYGKMGAFWAMSSQIMGEGKSIVGFAFINFIGQLGGLIGPFLIGLLRDYTGDFKGALIVLCFFSVCGASLSLICLPKNFRTTL